jgi:hypothetical protein
LPIIEEQVDPTVWRDGHTVGQAQTAVPILIHLKEPSWFPHQKQYPLKPEVKEGLIPIIKDLKRAGGVAQVIECLPSKYKALSSKTKSRKEKKIDLKRQGLLIECSSPYNTPILGVRRGPNKWRLLQDLHMINEAVVPLHPAVPSPYMLLAQILPGTTYYSVLDL